MNRSIYGSFTRVHKRRIRTWNTQSRGFRASSQLGSTSSESTSKEHEVKEISDAEWELRAGRAISVIRDTMPDFFKLGLVERTTDDDTGMSIYSPRIQLLYTPPTRLPPLPQTLQIDGLPMYHASSVFVRHTLSMFYTDLSVELRKLHETKAGHRDRRFTLGVGVLGVSRMGGSAAEWDVSSTYYISPTSGLVYKHVVESIHPAPHSSIYSSLASALARLSGFKTTPETPVPGAVPIVVEEIRR